MKSLFCLHSPCRKANRRTAKPLFTAHRSFNRRSRHYHACCSFHSPPAGRFALRASVHRTHASLRCNSDRRKIPRPFPGRRKGARPNPIYNEKPRNCGVTLIATAVPGMGYKGILPKRACRMVFAYFLPKQKVGNPRRIAGGGELSPAKKHPAYRLSSLWLINPTNALSSKPIDKEEH